MRLLQTFEDLLIAAQNGDREAENYLFTKLRARVLTLVQQRIWNNQSPADKIRHDAEDLTADICLKIIEKYKTISFQNSFMPWVFQIVRNKVGDYYRKRDRKQNVEVARIDESYLPDGNGDVSTVEIVEQLELDNMITAVLEKIKGRCRDIIIALLQGRIKNYVTEQQKTVPVATVYSHIHRCRQRFMTLLQVEGFEL